MRTLRYFWFGLATALVAVSVWSGAEAQPSGVVLAVVQSAEVDSTTGKKVLQTEAPVYSGDRIVTGASGEAQVKFRDDTKLVVGPNSTMIIDAYVFNDDNTARQISVNMLRGAFRFITGNSRKDAYSITTPTATIGVRGTEFDVTSDEWSTRVAQYSGTTLVCNRRPDDPAAAAKWHRDCQEIRDRCGVTVAPYNDRLERVHARDVRDATLTAYFPYALYQDTLLRQFRVNVSGACGAILPAATGGDNGPPLPPYTPPPYNPPGKPDHPRECERKDHDFPKWPAHFPKDHKDKDKDKWTDKDHKDKDKDKEYGKDGKDHRWAWDKPKRGEDDYGPKWERGPLDKGKWPKFDEKLFAKDGKDGKDKDKNRDFHVIAFGFGDLDGGPGKRPDHDDRLGPFGGFKPDGKSAEFDHGKGGKPKVAGGYGGQNFFFQPPPSGDGIPKLDKFDGSYHPSTFTNFTGGGEPGDHHKPGFRGGKSDGPDAFAYADKPGRSDKFDTPDEDSQRGFGKPGGKPGDSGKTIGFGQQRFTTFDGNPGEGGDRGFGKPDERSTGFSANSFDKPDGNPGEGGDRGFGKPDERSTGFSANSFDKPDGKPGEGGDRGFGKPDEKSVGFSTTSLDKPGDSDKGKPDGKSGGFAQAGFKTDGKPDGKSSAFNQAGFNKPDTEGQQGFNKPDDKSAGDGAPDFSKTGSKFAAESEGVNQPETKPGDDKSGKGQQTSGQSFGQSGKSGQQTTTGKSSGFGGQTSGKPEEKSGKPDTGKPDTGKSDTFASQSSEQGGDKSGKQAGLSSQSADQPDEKPAGKSAGDTPPESAPVVEQKAAVTQEPAPPAPANDTPPAPEQKSVSTQQSAPAESSSSGSGEKSSGSTGGEKSSGGSQSSGSQGSQSSGSQGFGTQGSQSSSGSQGFGSQSSQSSGGGQKSSSGGQSSGTTGGQQQSSSGGQGFGSQSGQQSGGSQGGQKSSSGGQTGGSQQSSGSKGTGGSQSGGQQSNSFGGAPFGKPSDGGPQQTAGASQSSGGSEPPPPPSNDAPAPSNDAAPPAPVATEPAPPASEPAPQ